MVASVAAPGGAASGDLPAAELERRLLEMGFVEGAKVEILHEGLFGADPIAVKLDDMRVALRRRDARGVMVRTGI
ncbi:MAG TPA: FeoA family protein [Caulobacteraceae bacterium]